MRFAPRSQNAAVLLGQPVDEEIDVGAAVRDGKEVQVAVFSGSSVLDPGLQTDRVETIERILSPLAQEEVGTIRCIGLNVCRKVFQSRRRLTDQAVCPTRDGSQNGYSVNPNSFSVSVLPVSNQSHFY